MQRKREKENSGKRDLYLEPKDNKNERKIKVFASHVEPHNRTKIIYKI